MFPERETANLGFKLTPVNLTGDVTLGYVHLCAQSVVESLQAQQDESVQSCAPEVFVFGFDTQCELLKITL